MAGEAQSGAQLRLVMGPLGHQQQRRRSGAFVLCGIRPGLASGHQGLTARVVRFGQPFKLAEPIVAGVE